MKTHFASWALLATSALALSAVSAQADQANRAKPRFEVIPANAPWHEETARVLAHRAPAAQISQWNGSFKDQHGTTRTFTMIGADPSSSDATTTIPFLVVPVIFNYTTFGVKFNPKRDKYADGETVLKNFTNSPLVNSDIDFKSAGQDLGKGQYIDEYQRGNFWNANVKGNPNYHVVLGAPQVIKPLKITVTGGTVETNPFGTQKVGLYNFGSMDGQINNYIRTHSNVTPDKFVFFISHNIFLTSGGCCIGGYHTATAAQPGGQTYGYTTLVTESGSFSQDVSAASHEIGEWLDDPFTNNRVGCNDNGILEVGDPLEGRANYGAFPYPDHGFTYNLQDLVYIGYFGAPRSTSVGSQLSFNNLEQNICPGQ